jgi:hypothetical protein
LGGKLQKENRKSYWFALDSVIGFEPETDRESFQLIELVSMTLAI